MALVICAECTTEISSEARSCPKCGAKPTKKTSLATWLVGAVFLVVIFKSCSAINEKTVNSPEERSASTTPAAPLSVSWSYTTDTDQMTSKPTNYARLTSLNTLALARPYAGDNYGRLIIRKKSGKAEEVLVNFDQGQSMCKSYSPDCIIDVRFDDAPPLRLSGVTPPDGSSTTVFLTSPAKFITAAKKATSIKIALEIYQAGTQIFEFRTPEPLMLTK